MYFLMDMYMDESCGIAYGFEYELDIGVRAVVSL